MTVHHTNYIIKQTISKETIFKSFKAGKHESATAPDLPVFIKVASKSFHIKEENLFGGRFLQNVQKMICFPKISVCQKIYV